MRRIRLLAVLTALLACLLSVPATATADPAAAARTPLGSGSMLYTSSGGRCFASFAATSDGTGYLITGPCGGPGTTIYGRIGDRYVVIGPIVASQFASMVAVVRVANTTDWVLVPTVPTGSGSIVLKGSVEAPIGATVCRFGYFTGWRCGTVLAKNMTITFPHGTVYGVTRTSACAEQGEAGAAFVHGDQAQGVLIGVSGGCSTGGDSYFLPINRILSTYGLTLLTG